jgi:hypothetical protein
VRGGEREGREKGERRERVEEASGRTQTGKIKQQRTYVPFRHGKHAVLLLLLW